MVPFPDQLESNLIHDYLILPYVLKVLERDKKGLRTSKLKFPQLYVNLMKQIMDNVAKGLTSARKGLRTSGIYVYRQEETDKGLIVKYKYKGYHHNSSYIWGSLKSFFMTKIAEYLGQSIVKDKAKVKLQFSS